MIQGPNPKTTGTPQGLGQIGTNQVTIQAANQNWESDQDTFAAMVATFTAP